MSGPIDLSSRVSEAQKQREEQEAAQKAHDHALEMQLRDRALLLAVTLHSTKGMHEKAVVEAAEVFYGYITKGE